MSENNINDPQSDHSEFELSHSDKLVGVFTEPAHTFKSISGFPLRFGDWLIPLVVVVILSVVSSFLLFSQPNIKMQYEQKSMQQVDKNLQKQVANGDITAEQAGQAREISKTFIVIGFYVFRPIGIILLFFVSALVIFLILRYGLKGEGGYSAALVAMGLPQYITVIGTIVSVIISLALDKFIISPSVGSIIGADERTFTGYLLNMIDIFYIWYLILATTGFIYLYKAKNHLHYYLVTFGLWILLSLFFFAIS